MNKLFESVAKWNELTVKDITKGGPGSGGARGEGGKYGGGGAAKDSNTGLKHADGSGHAANVQGQPVAPVAAAAPRMVNDVREAAKAYAYDKGRGGKGDKSGILGADGKYVGGNGGKADPATTKANSATVKAEADPTKANFMAAKNAHYNASDRAMERGDRDMQRLHAVVGTRYADKAKGLK